MSPDFPCDRFLAIVNQSPKPAMSVLWGTFGSSPSCVAAFVASNAHRPHMVQIHFSNETCRRNRNCQDGELHGELSVKAYNQTLEHPRFDVITSIVERAEQIKAFAHQFGNANTTWVLGAGLEDNYSNTAYSVVEFILRKHWGGIISRNPLKGRARGGAELLEKHGKKPTFGGQPCIANQDGSQGSYSSTRAFIKKYRMCAASFIWRSAHQGRPGNHWVPIEERIYVIPDEDIANLGAILRTSFD